MRLDKAAMVRALHDEPKFSELFISISSLEMSALKRTWSINCSIRARSAWRGCFLLMANFGKEGRPEPVIAKVSQDFAEMVGTTRSRVSFFMNKFRKLGFIDSTGA